MNNFRGILEHIGRTPLVPLRRLGAGLPVPVLVKCEHMNPGGSVKDRIALAIVADAEQLAPLGLALHFVNDVAAFHFHEGETHCGSNQLPVLPFGPARPHWWEQAPA